MADTPQVTEQEYWRSAQQWVDCQDLLDALLQPVLDHLLTAADLRLGQSVLDIGCGTGASTMAAAQAVGSDGRVLGADVSGIMLDVARQRSANAGLHNVDFVEDDAQTHVFSAGVRDVVLSRFGVMFFADPVEALQNIMRAVKPDGALVFLCWADLANNPWFSVPRQAAVDVLGAPPASDPYAPGPMAFADQAHVAKILRYAGWKDLAVEAVALELTPKGTLSDVADFATHLGPASRIIKDAGGSATETKAIEEKVTAGLAAFDTGQGLRVPAQLNLVKARAGSARV